MLMHSIAYVAIGNATTRRSDDPTPIAMDSKTIQSLANLLTY